MSRPLHPFIESSIASLKREAKSLVDALGRADVREARAWLAEIQARLTLLEQEQIRLLNEEHVRLAAEARGRAKR